METLRYGSKGPMVEYLQLALERAGYDPGNIDGIFGKRTHAALEQFQRANGLAADGIAGRLTWAKLFPYLAGYTIHIVRAGDTLHDIAKMHDTTVNAIETANPEIEAQNLALGAELVVPLDFPVVPVNVNYSYALLALLIDGLTARYPFLREGQIGTSVMGKPICSIAIGQGEKQVSYNASHHANEWITTPVLMQFLERYASAYVNSGSIAGTPARTLYHGATLYLVPMVNPDGVDLVTGALKPDDSYYRQAAAFSEYYPGIPFPSGWKANISGVDLNLGYPAEWERARSIKFAEGFTRPGPRDYVGTAPLAEPENRAMARFTELHDFRLTLSYHTQGRTIYWKFADYEPENSRAIAEAFSKASGYLVEETPYRSGFAGYKDWFIQSYDLPGYTIEAGQGQNPLPLSQFADIYRENEGILTLGMVLAPN